MEYCQFSLSKKERGNYDELATYSSASHNPSYAFPTFLGLKKKGFSLSLLFKHGEKRGEESLLNLIFLQYTMAGRNMLKRSTFFLCFFLWQLKISSMQTIY